MNDPQLIIIDKCPLSELAAYLKDKDVVAFDSETTGVEKDSEIIGFSIAAECDKAYYVILAKWDVKLQKLVHTEAAPWASETLRLLVGKKLVMHNALFDCAMVKNNYSIDLMPSVDVDTMILAHINNENRRVGLKELAVSIYGETATEEQRLMRQSVYANGGVLTKEKYELYKADPYLIARYGAMDTILTLKVLYHELPDLFAQNLDSFFFDDESMPLLRGPTYDLNTTGLRVDSERLAALKGTLEAECEEAKAFIHREIEPLVKAKYPGTSKAKTFNIGAGQQLAWLIFVEMGEEFHTLTKGGRALAKALDLKVPYTRSARHEFIEIVTERFGVEWEAAKLNPKTQKMGKPKKIGRPWTYMSCGKESLGRIKDRYKWVERLLEYKKNLKLLNTYVEGIQTKMKYGIIRPSFLQHGTTSGRYSSKQPNFQNLPRDDKRIKSCIISRPGKVFVGADYSQLEPRVFASQSQDARLLKCFADGDDFYSVVGEPIFDAYGCTLKKDGTPNSWPVKHPKLRDKSKIIALATPYGRTAFLMAQQLGCTNDEAQEIIDRYFASYPSVQAMMLQAHDDAKANGVVYNLFGRPRRMPEAMLIPKVYGKNTPHAELPYVARNTLNLAMNHKVQSTGASIMNRAAIAVWQTIQELAKNDARWLEVKIILQVHDELILEGPEALADDMVAILKYCMEETVILPGVALIAEPKVATNLADLK